MVLVSCAGAMSSGLRLEDSPFGPYDFMNASSSPLSPPGSVGDGWPNRAKSPHGSSNVNWPPGERTDTCTHPDTHQMHLASGHIS